ncbi:MAG: DNA cytosine methyltransferase, partial [Promethearchaeota archaeon]
VFIHYKFNRVLTPRELAALQSFDDTFIFKGTKSSILKQIGNAVPPLMAKAIAKQIKIHLNELYQKKTSKY